jgi:cell division septal protein FtsQ
VKEGAFWRGSAVSVFAVGGVLITAAAIALCTPWFGLIDLREVVITGNHHAAAADLVGVAGLQRGQSLLTLSLRRIRANIMRHPWVKDVSLDRRWPHRLVIGVEERAETAWMTDPSGEGCLTVGEGGVIVSTDCEHASALPELRGARLSGTDPGSVLLDGSIDTLIGALREGELAALGAELIDLTDPDSVELTTSSGLKVLLGGIDVALLRLKSLTALSRSLNVEDYEIIDLRFGGEATLVPR